MNRTIAGWRTRLATRAPGLADRFRLIRAAVSRRPEGTAAARIVEALGDDLDDVLPVLAYARPGHFESPLPSLSEAREVERRRGTDGPPVPAGIDFRLDEQVALLAELSPLVADIDLPREPTDGWRYHDANLAFGRADAMLFAGILRWTEPHRVVEVGSGWSSALLLDMVERYLTVAPAITCIDPYPDALRQRLRDGDEVEIIGKPVQEVDLAPFLALEAGDICFIDSTHIVKYGSDVHHELSVVLPALAPGVLVHFHDIGYPFEIPPHFIPEGRAWNECYALGAFLQFNRRFEVLAFSHQLAAQRAREVAEIMPALLESAGGSLWLRVTDRD